VDPGFRILGCIRVDEGCENVSLQYNDYISSGYTRLVLKFLSHPLLHVKYS
jgi:hypothetical protein